MEEMPRAPSSGVKCCFSTAVRTSFTSLSATCHFGSIVGPNSAGFITANCRTSDGVTVSAMTLPPFVSENGLRGSCCQAQGSPAPALFANSEVERTCCSRNLRPKRSNGRKAAGRQHGSVRSASSQNPSALMLNPFGPRKPQRSCLDPAAAAVGASDLWSECGLDSTRRSSKLVDDSSAVEQQE